jgi:hypothetical protein
VKQAHDDTMVDDPENHTLAWTWRLDSKIDQVLQTQSEHDHRLARIELGLARSRGEQASDAEAVAILSTSIDRLREEVDPIKRRLDLSDA